MYPTQTQTKGSKQMAVAKGMRYKWATIVEESRWYDVTLEMCKQAYKATKESNSFIVRGLFGSLSVLYLRKLSFVADEKYDRLDPYRCVYIEPKGLRSDVTQLGHMLNDIGGTELMRTVAELLPTYDQCEINWAWNNIGEWVA